MAVDFEALQRAETKNESQIVEADVLSLPPGFIHGFNVTWDDFKVTVGAGSCIVAGAQVSRAEPTLIVDRMWQVERNQSTHYYIYLTREGDFQVELLSPVQNDDVFYREHPISGARFLGRLYIDSDGDAVFGTSTNKVISEVLVGASTWLEDSDYLCDATNDEVEINAALRYISGIGGGRLILSAGTFNVSAQINLLSNVWIDGAGEGHSILSKTDTTASYSIISEGESDTITDIRLSRFQILSNENDGNTASSISLTGVSDVAIESVIIKFSPYRSIVVSGGDRVVIARCTIVNANNSSSSSGGFGAITMTTVSEARILDCEFYADGDALTGTTGAFAQIRITGSTDSGIISGCYIHDIISTTASPYGIAVSSGNVQITGNTIERLQALDHGEIARGIYHLGLSGDDTNFVQADIVQNNRIADVVSAGTSSDQTHAGVGIYAVNNMPIVANVVQNCGTGITIAGANCAVMGNSAWDCGNLVIRGSCEDTTGPTIHSEVSRTLSNASFARSSAQADTGTYSYEHIITAGGSVSEVFIADGTSTTDMHDMVPGVTYVFRARIRQGTGTITASEFDIGIRDYHAGAWVESADNGLLSSSVWNNISVIHTVDTEATGFGIFFRIAATASSGESVYVDNISFRPARFSRTGTTNAHDALVFVEDETADRIIIGNSWQAVG